MKSGEMSSEQLDQQGSVWEQKRKNIMILNMVCLSLSFVMLCAAGTLFIKLGGTLVEIQKASAELQKTINDAAEVSRGSLFNSKNVNESVQKMIERIEKSDQVAERVQQLVVEANAAVKTSEEIAEKTTAYYVDNEHVTQDVKEVLPSVVEAAAQVLEAAEKAQEVALNTKPLTITSEDEQDKAQVKTSLEQIGRAIRKYNSAFQKYPDTAFGGNPNKPLLSWRVQLLPYLGQKALFEKFKLDEPWDSKHNKRLISSMPMVFQDPSVTAKYRTTYLLPVGEHTIFAEGRGKQARQITDGEANTVVLVVTDDKNAVVWTQPQDYEYDSQNPFAGLKTDEKIGVTLLMADGVVKNISEDTPQEILQSLFTSDKQDSVADLLKYIRE